MTTPDLQRRSKENLKTVRASFPAKFEARKDSSGQPSGLLIGYASVTETPYVMRDMFGEYDEVISKGAFLKTLSENPNVRYLVNHSGLSHGTTLNGALTLVEDDLGLRSEIQLDMRRTDSQDLWYAVDSGACDRMSFMFEIVRQEWSPDWMTRRIDEVRMADGDVSVVNFPANPAATVGARSKIKDLKKARARATDLIDHIKRDSLSPDDLAVLASAMAVLLEADEALDPLVNALTTADDAIDDAAEAIAEVTGIPSPLDSDDDEGMSVEEALALL
jgi:HK97 family phage prohead protease